MRRLNEFYYKRLEEIREELDEYIGIRLFAEDANICVPYGASIAIEEERQDEEKKQKAIQSEFCKRPTMRQRPTTGSVPESEIKIPQFLRKSEKRPVLLLNFVICVYQKKAGNAYEKRINRTGFYFRQKRFYGRTGK